MSLHDDNANRPGVALVVALMVLLATSAIAAGAAMIGSNAWIINHYTERHAVLELAADAGLEEGRARVNGHPDLFPDEGYTVIEDEAPVFDAAGEAIPNIFRSTYIGPTGTTTGEHGSLGSIVTVASDGHNQVIRRVEIEEESFAKYAYFTDVEPNIVFGADDILFGPVHSNDVIDIQSDRAGATFHGPVTTARTIANARNAVFHQGYQERAERIEMPDVADLNRLRTLATEGQMAFTSTSSPTDSSQAMMRIEFVEIEGHGFVKIYEARNLSDAHWVTATIPSGGMGNSENCGHYHVTGTDTVFVAAADHSSSGADDWKNSLKDGGRCYLGGSDSIFGEFREDDSRGSWLPHPVGSTELARDVGRPDSAYLFPISRALNPGFKGVIHVDGKVAVSGVVRGQVTLAATDNIIVADDLKYSITPGDPARNCLDGDVMTHDILGLFAGGSIIVADNTMNAPVSIEPSPNPFTPRPYISLGHEVHETIHATLLTLNVFTVDNDNSGSDDAEPCEGSQRGRGCLYVEGGIIQRQRGIVGWTDGTGNTKRYSYDECVQSNPPPYFPTTGRFTTGRYYEIDPAGFDIDEFFELHSSS